MSASPLKPRGEGCFCEEKRRALSRGLDTFRSGDIGCSGQVSSRRRAALFAVFALGEGCAASAAGRAHARFGNGMTWRSCPDDRRKVLTRPRRPEVAGYLEASRRECDWICGCLVSFHIRHPERRRAGTSLISRRFAEPQPKDLAGVAETFGDRKAFVFARRRVALSRSRSDSLRCDVEKPGRSFDCGSARRSRRNKAFRSPPLKDDGAER